MILKGVLVGLQKSNFLHRQSLYPGTSYVGSTVLQEVHLYHDFNSGPQTACLM